MSIIENIGSGMGKKAAKQIFREERFPKAPHRKHSSKDEIYIRKPKRSQARSTPEQIQVYNRLRSKLTSDAQKMKSRICELIKNADSETRKAINETYQDMVRLLRNKKRKPDEKEIDTIRTVLICKQKVFSAYATERNSGLDRLMIRWIGRINALSVMKHTSLSRAVRTEETKKGLSWTRSILSEYDKDLRKFFSSRSRKTAAPLEETKPKTRFQPSKISHSAHILELPVRLDLKSSFPKASSTYSKRQIQLDKSVDEGIARAVKNNSFFGLELEVLPQFANAEAFMKDEQGGIIPFKNPEAKEKFENFIASFTRLEQQYKREKEQFLRVNKSEYEKLDRSIFEEIAHKVNNADEETSEKLNAQRLLAYERVEDRINAKIDKLNFFRKDWLEKEQQAKKTIQSDLKRLRRRKTK